MGIMIVDDGQCLWGADRQEIEAAMLAAEWTQDGNLWKEPRGSDYEDLCASVTPAPGFYPEDDQPDWDQYPALVWREDLRAWEVQPA